MKLTGDKALTDAAEDKLGFATTADAIAIAILEQPNPDGLVVGIEGRWGSGKSSLVNMIVGSLRHAECGISPEIIEFKPWLIGDRDSLLLSLFTELAIAVDAIEESCGDPTGRQRRELGEAGKKIVGFAAQLGGAGTLVKAAGAFIPGAALAGEALDAAAKAAKAWDGKRSIAQEKAELRKRLRSLQRRIIITIDDVDRLEPGEVVEVLRLIRSVADFPNVIYLLCYDPRIVAHSIEIAAHVDSGQAYIEKIVQVSVPVPAPEAFDLRRWFREELSALPRFSNEADDSALRLASVIDHEGGRYLLTPRHVVRCLDSIRFFWKFLQEKVDLSDFIWLHLVKVGNPKLYDWIENYLLESAAQSSGFAIIGDAEKAKARESLNDALGCEDSELDTVRHRLAEFLPGFGGVSNFVNGKDFSVHTYTPPEEAARSARAKRLSSPDHYRLYFANQQPRNSPQQKDFDDLIQSLDESVEIVVSLFLGWNSQQLSTGASKAEVMLSRIAGSDGRLVEQNRAQALLYAMADCMDELASKRQDQFGEPHSWMEGSRVFEWLISLLGDHREEVLVKFFQGKSLEWLTRLLRDETFAHGRAGSHPRGDNRLEADELDRVSSIMVSRYRKLDLENWKALRRPLSALYAWLQAGDMDGPKSMVSRETASDEGLLSVLELMSGRIRSSKRGEYAALQRSHLHNFIAYDNARKRTEDIARSSENSALKDRAIKLVLQFEADDH